MHHIRKHMENRVHRSLRQRHVVRERAVKRRRHRKGSRISCQRQAARVEADRIDVHERHIEPMHHGDGAFRKSSVDDQQIKATLQQVLGLTVIQHCVA